MDKEVKKNKLDIKAVGKQFLRAAEVLQKNIKFIFIVIVLLTYGFLVFRIGILSNAEPSLEEVDEITKDIKKPRIDKNAVDAILQLESENIQVKTLFQEARENPFNE